MNRWVSGAATALLVLTIVVAAALAAAWIALPLDGTTITIALVVTLAALVVAAIAVVLGLAVAVLGIAVGVLATVASLALVASPFLLVGWLVWRAVRRPSAVPVAPA
jgi:hypothetical protein